MELVSDEKLEAVANFLTNIEVNGDYLCRSFLEYLNEVLKENRVDVPCNGYTCEGNCPFYSKESFLEWIKNPYKKLDVKGLKKPKKEEFLCYDDEYTKALEEYCDDLENVLADTEYDLETAECENRELTNKLEKIRGVLDGPY